MPLRSVPGYTLQPMVNEWARKEKCEGKNHSKKQRYTGGTSFPKHHKNKRDYKHSKFTTGSTEVAPWPGAITVGAALDSVSVAWTPMLPRVTSLPARQAVFTHSTVIASTIAITTGTKLSLSSRSWLVVHPCHTRFGKENRMHLICALESSSTHMKNHTSVYPKQCHNEIEYHSTLLHDRQS
jgi:hypothetical protein